MDNSALYKLCAGLYLLSSASGNKKGGCIINTLQQVTSKPAQLMIGVNKNNYTAGLIRESGLFCATVLTEATDMSLISAFGFRSGRDTDKFDGIAAKKDADEIPYVSDTMSAAFSCRVTGKLDVGTHILFVGELRDARVLSDLPVMTYEYYHQVKKGATPKNAPSYQEKAEGKGFRCTVCGYIEREFDILPDDYVCPVCKQPRDVFVPL